MLFILQIDILNEVKVNLDAGSVFPLSLPEMLAFKLTLLAENLQQPIVLSNKACGYAGDISWQTDVSELACLGDCCFFFLVVAMGFYPTRYPMVKLKRGATTQPAAILRKGFAETNLVP